MLQKSISIKITLFEHQQTFPHYSENDTQFKKKNSEQQLHLPTTTLQTLCIQIYSQVAQTYTHAPANRLTHTNSLISLCLSDFKCSYSYNFSCIHLGVVVRRMRKENERRHSSLWANVLLCGAIW